MSRIRSRKLWISQAAFALAGCSSFSFGATTLSLGSPELSSSAATSLPIILRTTDAAVAALQVDVLYDGESFATSGAIAGELSDSFRVSSDEISPGKLRVVIYSAKNNAFQNGVMFRVPFTSKLLVPPADPQLPQEPLSVPVVLTNFILSAAGGVRIQAKVAPAVLSRGLASSVSFTSANLSASINPNGSAATVYFEYGPTTSYGSVTSLQQVGSSTGVVSVSGSLSNLLPHTEYHFRLVATDAEGSMSVGASQAFTTLNRKPVALDDLFHPVKGTIPLSLRVRDNDSDLDGDTLTVTAVTSGVFGSVTTDGASVIYTPGANYTARDSFTYTVSDGFGGTNTATVQVFAGKAEIWRQMVFGADAGNPLIAGDAANPDRDGISNLLEYALGGNPNNPADVGVLPEIRSKDGRLMLSFVRDSSNYDLTYAVEATNTPEDTASWQVIAEGKAGGALSAQKAGVAVAESAFGGDPNLRRVEVKDSLQVTEVPRRFLRLRVVR